MSLSEPIRQLVRSGDVRGDAGGATYRVEPGIMEVVDV